MNKIIPFFEVGNKRYEIKRTRYLLAEYDKLGEQNTLSNEDKQNAIKAQSLIGDIQRYVEKEKELWNKFCDTLEDEDERKYLKIKALREQSLDKLAALEVESGSTTRLQKATIDLLETIVIKGLAEQYYSKEMSDDVTPSAIDKATKTWESYVDVIGKTKASEWLTNMAECLFGEDEEEDNSFLSQMRKRAEERAINRKQGLTKKK